MAYLFRGRKQIQNIENARGTSAKTSSPTADLLWSLAEALEIESGELFPSLSSQQKGRVRGDG